MNRRWRWCCYDGNFKANIPFTCCIVFSFIAVRLFLIHVAVILFHCKWLTLHILFQVANNWNVVGRQMEIDLCKLFAQIKATNFNKISQTPQNTLTNIEITSNSLEHFDMRKYLEQKKEKMEQKLYCLGMLWCIEIKILYTYDLQTWQKSQCHTQFDINTYEDAHIHSHMFTHMTDVRWHFVQFNLTKLGQWVTRNILNSKVCFVSRKIEMIEMLIS